MLTVTRTIRKDQVLSIRVLAYLCFNILVFKRTWQNQMLNTILEINKASENLEGRGASRTLELSCLGFLGVVKWILLVCSSHFMLQPPLPPPPPPQRKLGVKLFVKIDCMQDIPKKVQKRVRIRRHRKITTQGGVPSCNR